MSEVVFLQICLFVQLLFLLPPGLELLYVELFTRLLAASSTYGVEWSFIAFLVGENQVLCWLATARKIHAFR